MCFHRYTGRGLFLDPPTVYMCNGVWKLSLPEALHLEIPKLENKGKPYIFFKSTIILNCHLDLILCLFFPPFYILQPSVHVMKFFIR